MTVVHNQDIRSVQQTRRQQGKLFHSWCCPRLHQHLNSLKYIGQFSFNYIQSVSVIQFAYLLRKTRWISSVLLREAKE